MSLTTKPDLQYRTSFYFLNAEMAGVPWLDEKPRSISFSKETLALSVCSFCLPRRPLEIFLRFSERVLRDSLLCSNSASVVPFRLLTGFLNLADRPASDASLPSADGGTEDATHSQYRSEPNQAPVKYKLLFLIIAITDLGFTCLILKVIETTVKNGESTFVVNYAIVAVLLIVAQLTCYLELKKILG